MKPRKLKELLVFAIINKSPELLPIGKREQLEEALMKLNAEELETLEEFIGRMFEQTRPATRRKRGGTDEDEEDINLEDEQSSK